MLPVRVKVRELDPESMTTWVELCTYMDKEKLVKGADPFDH
jgi:hypothetical protein